jgi:hypothetical protein
VPIVKDNCDNNVVATTTHSSVISALGPPLVMPTFTIVTSPWLTRCLLTSHVLPILNSRQMHNAWLAFLTTTSTLLQPRATAIAQSHKQPPHKRLSTRPNFPRGIPNHRQLRQHWQPQLPRHFTGHMSFQFATDNHVWMQVTTTSHICFHCHRQLRYLCHAIQDCPSQRYRRPFALGCNVTVMAFTTTANSGNAASCKANLTVMDPENDGVCGIDVACPSTDVAKEVASIYTKKDGQLGYEWTVDDTSRQLFPNLAREKSTSRRYTTLSTGGCTYARVRRSLQSASIQRAIC